MENQSQVSPGSGSFKKDTPDSSSVKRVAYEASKLVLTIEFKNGGVYDYYGVPQKVATEVYNSKSLGAAPRNELKDYKGVKRAE